MNPRVLADLRLRIGVRLAALVLLLVLVGCTSPQPRPTARTPDEVRAQLVHLIPPKTPDRAGWAADIQSSFQMLDIPPSTENLCAALAVIAQESTFVADPVVPDLGRIARKEIEHRAAQHHVPAFAVGIALKLKSSDGRSYADRIARVRSERELSEIYEDLIGRVPLGRQLFADSNPVRTGGPMQVSIAFAERHAADHANPFAADGSIRYAVFTRRGGLYFGIAHLLDYPSNYPRHIYRFADFNVGWYASRNAAFQNALGIATGVPLALDGDLLVPGRLSATEAAARTLGPQLGLGDAGIHRQLGMSDGLAFEESALYRGVFEIADRRKGKPMAREMIPQIRLESPKITRKLTTEWFANRVQARYQRCVNQAFADIRQTPD
jgi:hypothetical protein